MPLRVDNGIQITVEPSPVRELLGRLTDFTAFPEEGLLDPAPPHERLDIRPIRQINELWCWAACARMVLSSFPEQPLTQCQVADRIIDRSCCDTPTPDVCDIDLTIGEITFAFRQAGLSVVTVGAPVSFERVVAQISGTNGAPRRPLVAAIGWQGGGGHVVVICGARVVDNIRYLRVNDPLYGPGDIRYDDLVGRYGRNDTGRWIHTWLGFSRP